MRWWARTGGRWTSTRASWPRASTTGRCSPSSRGRRPRTRRSTTTSSRRSPTRSRVSVRAGPRRTRAPPPSGSSALLLALGAAALFLQREGGFVVTVVAGVASPAPPAGRRGLRAGPGRRRGRGRRAVGSAVYAVVAALSAVSGDVRKLPLVVAGVALAVGRWPRAWPCSATTRGPSCPGSCRPGRRGHRRRTAHLDVRPQQGHRHRRRRRGDPRQPHPVVRAQLVADHGHAHAERVGDPRRTRADRPRPRPAAASTWPTTSCSGCR